MSERERCFYAGKLVAATARRGRGRNQDHDCGEYDAPSVPFRRLDYDCPGCGECHQDWERCAAAVWELHQQAKAREQTGGREA